MALCNKTTEVKEKWLDTMDEIYTHWAKKPGIINRFTDKYRGYNEESSAENMQWWIQQKMNLPFSDDLPLDASKVRRIKVEIDAYDKALKGKFGNFVFVVPEGTSKADPTARKFYTNLGNILNYERVQVNKLLGANSKISEHLFEAYLSEHKVSKFKGKLQNYLGKTAIDEMRSLRNDMLRSEPNDNLHLDFENKMKEFVKSDEGKTIKDFIELIHLPDAEFRQVQKSNYRDKNNVLRNYNGDLYQAVVEARKSLNSMGGVYLNSLNSLKKIISLKYANTTNTTVGANTNAKAARLMKVVDDTVVNVREGIKQGGYFPHITFESIVNIKEKLSEAMNSNMLTRDITFSTLVDEVLAKIDIKSLPHHVQRRNPLIEKNWEIDPQLVISEYGNQAIQFNKLINSQITYLDALKHIPNSDVNFMKGMKRFIDEEYSVFVRGTSARPEVANKMVTTLNSLATARTMGLNITGAIKNAASVLHYFSRVGWGTIPKTLTAIRHNEGQEIVQGKVVEPGFRDFLSKAEEEAGFLFTDAAKELYTEGLISKKQFNESNIEFDPLTGKFKIDGNSLKDNLVSKGKKAYSWTLDKALFFHKLTENFQRQWMYRTALHQKYSQLVSDGYSKKGARDFSKVFALNMVNGWAYEYSAHAKAKPLRGEWRVIEEMDAGTIRSKLQGTGGAVSEVAFHLLHYPMSLMESHWSSLKGAHKALLAKQFDADELKYAMRYAGLVGLIQASSAMLNIDFTNILENETQERITRVLTDLTEYDNPDRGTFGLMSEFTGPTLGTIKYIAIANSIIDLDHSDLNKILFGNVDYADEDDKLTELYTAYQYSTQWGMLKNKVLPTLRNGRGRDLFTHYLKLYPNKFTQKWNKRIWGGSNKAKKSKKALSSTEAAIKVLEGMRA